MRVGKRCRRLSLAFGMKRNRKSGKRLCEGRGSHETNKELYLCLKMAKGRVEANGKKVSGDRRCKTESMLYEQEKGAR